MPVPVVWRAAYRFVQLLLYAAGYIIPLPRPELLKGNGALAKLPAFIKGKKFRSCLLVTDEMIVKLGLCNAFLEKMKEEKIKVSIYQGVLPNPGVNLVEEAYELYKQGECDHMVAVGGGSSMDCAKMVGVRVARPGYTLKQLRGFCRVLRRIPPLIAVPTTAGTGSECTLAAVATDVESNEKFTLMDLFLFPPYAVLDASLTLGLPKVITGTTGMDALAHAVEAYCNLNRYGATDRDAKAAVQLISKYLLRAYDNGSDVEAREQMLEAAHFAGLAFTRAAVGNVHAAAHQLSAFYNVPHGLSIAITLPVVLDYYGPVVHRRLADLADAAGLPGATTEEKAKNFIAWIRALNKHMDIPERLSAADARYTIQEAHIPAMCKHAYSEANPFYPVPVIFGVEEFADIYHLIA